MDTLMIHDLRRELFDLDLTAYRLSFDDGLYSQYYYYPLLARHPAPLTYFITTGFIRDGAARGMFQGEFLPYVKTGVYAREAFLEGDFRRFMTTDEVRYLASRPNVRLGAHSHRHDVILTDVHPKKPKAPSAWKLARFAHVPAAVREGLAIRSRLAFTGFDYIDGRLEPRGRAAWEEEVARDTESLLEWFRTRLGVAPTAYCFPFNEYTPELVALLERFGFREFYAARPAPGLNISGRVDADRLVDGAPAPTGVR
jgi:peptidoglycan/xylan/chitin deacetylase (PgdA/CDA1 family)